MYVMVSWFVLAVAVCLVVWWHILIDEFYACCRCMLGCLVYILVDRLVFAVVVCLVHILIYEFYACCHCMLGCLVYILVDRLVFDTVWVLVIYIY